MNEFIQYHRILLIRARPGSEASRLGQDRAARLIEQGGHLLVFFHGEGVEHAAKGEPSAEWRSLADWHGVVLAVCSGSWSRRHRQPPDDPFVISSLTGFWNHALAAQEVACFGASDVG
ncbi:MAG: DsrE family protein [Xanthomonadales bacterium]|nr:DsrE family protein [Xanthomonadales bacterium]